MKKTILLSLILSLNLIAQAIVPKTVNITAGSLSTTLTAGELSTVTDLTITGTMDARDFVTLRSSMPVLAVLDLTNVTIAEYTGDGTNGLGTYPANTVPEKAFLIKGYNSTLTSVTFPTSLTAIGGTSFYYCTGLTSLIIPSSVTTIESRAFAFCSGLISISIPASVTSIGAGTFNGCSGSITVNADNPNYSSADGVLFNKTQSTLIQCTISKTGSYSISSSVTIIGEGAFWKCSSLTSISLPSLVTSIGDNAFCDCIGLSSISIPALVTTIGASAFNNCSGLNGTLTIPSSVTSIGNSAFYYCSGLSSISIPSSVTSFSVGLFEGCSGLKSFSIPSSVTTIESNAFSNCTGLTSLYAYAATPVNLSSKFNVFSSINKSTCTLYVPVGKVAAYDAAVQWTDFLNIVEMSSTGLHNQTTASINIYPNPATDFIQVKGIEGQAKLKITDLTGKIYVNQTVTGNSQLDVRKLKSGLYIVSITSAGKNNTFKITKQ